MADRAHDLLRRAHEPEPPTTAPMDLKLRSVALTIIAASAAIACNVCVPLLSVVVFHTYEYGDEVSVNFNAPST